ncbi:MAG: beta-ketoacyl-[acyl-carrier-protein] synthase family protein [Candidatus Omnitrophica bacterium]|nr:beta-ketoacyl-[acyl-carrier-protein] synthase family protein [Candidatus Omnitrophota bacterium]
MAKRVVITGIGVLAANGEGKDPFWHSLRLGQSRFGPITLFETGGYSVQDGGEILGFDPAKYLGPKGLRALDRSTMLIVSAARLAIDDSRLTVTDANTDDVGVSVGSTLGSLRSISEFDEVTLKEGPRYTNPAFFPNTVINAPASQVSIWHHIKGFNATISTGFTASVEAMQYAWDYIQKGRCHAVLAGGVEEMCNQTFNGLYHLKMLSGSRPLKLWVNCPFDSRRNGIVFAEAACLCVLEEYEHARQRGAAILAEVLGFGYDFDPFRINKYNPRGTGIKNAMRRCLTNSRLEPGGVDWISANANSTEAADQIETEAIKEVFGARARNIPVSAVKSMTGETYSASGALSVAAAVGAIQGGFIPPTMHYQDKDPACDLYYVPNRALEQKVNTVLVNTFGPNGAACCVALGAPGRMTKDG